MRMGCASRVPELTTTISAGRAAVSLQSLMASDADEGVGETYALEGDRTYTAYSRLNAYAPTRATCFSRRNMSNGRSRQSGKGSVSGRSLARTAHAAECCLLMARMRRSAQVQDNRAEREPEAIERNANAQVQPMISWTSRASLQAPVDLRASLKGRSMLFDPRRRESDALRTAPDSKPRRSSADATDSGTSSGS